MPRTARQARSSHRAQPQREVCDQMRNRKTYVRGDLLASHRLWVVFSRCSHSRRAPEAALAVGVRAVTSHRNRAESKVLPRCGCVGYLSCSRQRRRPGSGHLHSSAYFMLDVSACFPSTRRAATAAHVYARCSRAARLAMGARWTVRRLSGQAVRRDRSEAYRTYWGPPASECRVRLRAAYCVHHSNTL